MYPNICHIYGPLYLNCYGLSIAIGITAFSLLIKRNQTFQNLISYEKFKDVLLFGTIVGVICGRILWAIEDWHKIRFYEFFFIWEPGYSFLGTLIGLIIFGSIYLRKINVPVLPFLDVISIYIPLLHSISRIGCFLAGCCHGIPTTLPWGVVYTHEDVAVPSYLKFIKIHPTQLYNSLSLFLLFIAMYYFFQHKFTKIGQLSALYLIFASLDRLFNDFFRADRDSFDIPFINFLSYHQWLSIIVCLGGLLLFYYSSRETTKIKSAINLT